MDSSSIERYTYNLTHLVRQEVEVRSQLRGYDTCISRIFQILLQQKNMKKKCNPLLLDLDGKLRWQVLIEVVRRMAASEAPDPLPARQVVALNYEALFANVSASEESHLSGRPERPLPDVTEWEATLAASTSEEMFEQLLTKYFPGGLWPSLKEWSAPNEVLSRLQTLFLAVRQTEGQVLLFVNHFHCLLGGEQQNYSIDASTLLKPVLARREIQLIAACTPSQYQHVIEHDAAIARRLQECYLKPDVTIQDF